MRRKCDLIVALLLLLCGGQAGFARAPAAVAWLRLGPSEKPGSDNITAIWQDPHDAQRLICGARPGGLLLSLNGGATWTRTSRNIRTTIDSGSNAEAICADPVNPRRLLAGIEHLGCFRSEDRGLTWTEVNRGIRSGNARNGVSLAVSPADGRIVLYGSDGGMFRSTDGGATWRDVGEGLPQGKSAAQPKDIACTVSKIVFDPQEPRRVYAAIYGVGDQDVAGCYVSDDAGARWHAANVGIVVGKKPIPGLPFPLQMEMSENVALCPKHPETLYLCTVAGVYRSDDRAGHWRLTSYSEGATCLAVAADDARHVIIGSRTRVLSSTDGGTTWADITGNLPTQPLAGGEVSDLLITLPGGAQIHGTGKDRRFTPLVNCLRFDTRDPGIIWLAHSFGLYRAVVH
jgi:hypothetical protein